VSVLNKNGEKVSHSTEIIIQCPISSF